ncbi:MAG: hypothetical protein U1F76_09400 [Candidatus Competibacteraceae bacterium]
MTSPVENPYVGPRAFTVAERNRFFGREREARELLSRVIAERLVLFYAQSGAGKTSLINTCLVPQLKNKSVGYAVLPVGRVSGDLPKGVPDVANIFIFNLLLHLDQSNGDPGRFAAMSLKDFLVGLSSEDGEHYYYDAGLALEADSEGYQTPVHVLIVDQFEEIFSTHLERWQEREGFFHQLDEAMAADRQLWVVLSLREDYVAALDPYAPLLANHMRTRFYMQRMGSAVALEAIRRPAEQYGRPFAPGVAEQLVDNLRQIRIPGETVTCLGEFVEPVQLQVVCYQLWEKLKAREPGPITADDVRQLGDVDTALADFYEQAIARTVQTGAVSEVDLREWFSQKLITEARTRGTVYVGKTHTAGLANEVVKSLAEQYLLRGEMRAGGMWVELVHDRFVEPILRANERWLGNQSRLIQDAMAWEHADQDDSKLYVGEALAAALVGVGQGRQEPVVTAFLAASQEKNQALVERETARQRELEATRQLAEERARTATVLTRTATMLRRRAWVLAGIGVVSLLLAIIAFGFYRQAESAYRQAESAREFARKNQLAQTAELARQQNEKSNFTQGLLVSLGVIEASMAEFGEPLAVAESQLYRAVSNLREQFILTGHKDDITRVVLSPNGKRLATASRDTTVRLWDTANGQLLKTLSGHEKAVVDVAFSPDGKRLATASWDNTARLWDTTSGQLLATLEGHGEDRVVAVAFSPNDGTRLAIASGDNTAQLWDTNTGQLLATLESDEDDRVVAVAFSHDGTRLATAGGKTARLWEAVPSSQIPTPLTILKGHTDRVVDIAFSPNGKHLATASWDKTARLWDATASGTPAPLATLAGHRRPVGHVAFSPDGTRLATASWDKTARLWDTASGQLLATLTGHRRPVGHVAFSPDGTRLATASWDKTARLWDATASGTPAPLATLAGHLGSVVRVAFSPDGKLATASRDNTARLWNIDININQSVISLPLTGHESEVMAAAFSSGGTRLATASMDKTQLWDTAHLWDSANHQLLPTPLTDPLELVSIVAFSPDGKRLATTSRRDKTVRLWDTASGEPPSVISTSEPVAAVAFSLDGKRLATASRGDKIARLWDTASGEPLDVELKGRHEDDVVAVAFSPDGRLATVSEDKTARLWDTTTGQQLAVLRDHQSAITCLAFSPDGKLLATASWDNTARLWDTTSYTLIHTLKGHEGEIVAVAFSPYGTHLATASADNTARLWDTASGEPLAELTGHEDRVIGVAFNQDGTRLATASADNTVRWWKLFPDTQQLIDYAKNIKPRESDGDTVKSHELTRDECEQYSLPCQ